MAKVLRYPEGVSTSSQPRRRRTHSRRGRSPHAPAPFRPFTPEQLATRAAAIPLISFPDLPVSSRREEIAQAISQHQVVIISGETGSGKTTQIPKICLQLGRGVAGMIGHTQPRRIAARSVAERIAAELSQKVGKEPGEVVGYQVRFTDEVGPTTLIKLMTDGILLAEIQSDPMLRRYDTLIIDEAHERSLNIDFILGYLARLLPLRPDLKVIITSATVSRVTSADGTVQSDRARSLKPHRLLRFRVVLSRLKSATVPSPPIPRRPIPPQAPPPLLSPLKTAWPRPRQSRKKALEAASNNWF